MNNFAIKLFFISIILTFIIIICPVEGEIIITNLEQITSGVEHYTPRWSPDGSRIVYHTNSGCRDIWIMNIDDSNQTRITDNCDSTSTDWSPDGTKILYSTGTTIYDKHIWVMNIDGSNRTQLSKEPGSGGLPSFSLDGMRIAFEKYTGSNRDIWDMCVNGSHPRRLTTHFSSDWYPVYSPDGNKIIFGSDRSGKGDVWVMNIDGTNKVQITSTPWYELTCDWSPDGGKIVYGSNEAGNYDVWVMDANGSRRAQLTTHGARDIGPVWSPDGTKIVFESTRSGNMQIWVMTIMDTENPPEPPPTPTPNSLIITSDNWKNIISAVPVKIPVIVANQLTNEIEVFIDDYGPDYIYTIGFSAGLNNSYQIDYGQVPGLFFPNATQAILIENQTQGIFASNLAYYMDLPVIFDEDSGYDILDLSNKSIQEVQETYINELDNNGDQIDYLVLMNMESPASLFAGRVSGRRQGYIIPVNVPGIQYLENATASNENNMIMGIKETINETVGFLAEQGFYSDSIIYMKEGPLYLAILGDEYGLPFMVFWDPGNELWDDKDGNKIYSDLWYGDLNNDLFLDLAIGRFYGNLTSISLQLERSDMEKDNNATLIGLYRHRKYEDVYHMQGGMAQAWNAQRLLDIAGMNTRRIVEKRMGFSDDIDEFVKQIIEIGAKELIMRVMSAISESDDSILASSLGAITIIWPLADASSMINYAFYEYDWASWIDDMKQGKLGVPEHLEVFDVNTDLGNPKILGYFGLGDDYWLVPPEDRSELELVLDPYGRSEDFTELNFSNFLYDDHDLSINSSIAEQVISRGGMVFGSSGIIHDIYTTYTSNEFFRNVARGQSLGESLKNTININVFDDFKKVFYLVLKGIIPLPNLYVKDKLERVLLADPKYTPIEDGVLVEEPVWIIEPYHSYLSTTRIKPEYYIKNRIIYVTNADSLLIDQGQPTIPVFIREFILPEGSEIDDVDIRAYYRTYRRVNIPLVPWDEYYEGMPDMFDGDYPDKAYWHESYDLLDGRKLVRVYVPGVIYRNFKAKVLRHGKISVVYESPAEVIIEADDIKLGKNGTIEIEVISNDAPLNGTLWVWVEKTGFSEQFSRHVSIEQGESQNQIFVFSPTETGEYKVTAVLESDISVGPRHQYFEVWKHRKHKCCKWWCWLTKLLKGYKKYTGLLR